MSGKRYAGLSFEQVVKSYADTVAGVCVMRLQNYADAEDCFQNTFVRMYEKAPDFVSEAHLKAWLIRVAINECHSYRRKNCRTLPLESVKNVPDLRSRDEYDISWALARLEPKYRDALYLHYVERYKVDEIAAILGKKPNTVKTMLSRGRALLKKIYGGDDA